MGWFWADGPRISADGHGSLSAETSRSPPPSCPMHRHQQSADALTVPAPSTSKCPVKHDAMPQDRTEPAAVCPVPHGSRSSEAAESQAPSTLSKLNPLNYMFSDLSQSRAPNQSHSLPTSREPSTIPKGDGQGNWEYPSPQQMYNALLRKGYHDTDVTAVESMVSVHNFLNEGAWGEIMEWEKRFSGGLYRGWQVCSQGEQNFDKMVRRYGYEKEVEDLAPSLVRFQGRPKDMTPKAAMLQVMGWIYPAMFATEPPFDRHDWYVTRETNGQQKEIRYVIDYYSGPPEDDGEPVFYLDVRPALTPTTTVERALRWGSDVWWKASGGEVREAAKLEKEQKPRSA